MELKSCVFDPWTAPIALDHATISKKVVQSPKAFICLTSNRMNAINTGIQTDIHVYEAGILNVLKLTNVLLWELIRFVSQILNWLVVGEWYLHVTIATVEKATFFYF